MKIISKPRGAGKTSQLITFSCATGNPILVSSEQSKKLIKDTANHMNMSRSLPEPLNINSDSLKGLSHEKFLVDNAEVMLQELLGVEIGAITVNNGEYRGERG